METVVNYVENNKQRFLNELVDLVRIPSVSAQSQHRHDMQKCAQHLVQAFKDIGMESATTYDTPGHPIVYAEWLKAPGKPTILVYGHYDVQPEDPLNEWKTPPFEATLKDNQLFGRGTADDKGQFYIHLKAAEFYLKQHGKLPVNLKFLIEGEEEIGSRNLEKFITANKKLLACDTIMISDTSMLDKDMPSIIYGLRGLAYFQINVQGPNRDLHSGVFGGAVANPATALAQIIAKLKDDKGRVLIPGFYQGVKKLTAAERKNLKALPFNQKRYMQDLGVKALTPETGYTVKECLSRRPTLDIHGLLSGYTAEGPKTVIPAKAMAKVSVRLVPDQDPKKIVAAFEKYLKRITPKGVVATLQLFDAALAYMSPIDSFEIRTAQKALEKAFGKVALFTAEGGSIPVVSTFYRLLGKRSVLMGIGTPDEDIHSPNEKLYLPHFYKGIMASAYFMEAMASK